MAGSSPVSKRLEETRLAVDLSQKQLGIAAGMNQISAGARMNQYETGKHEPDYRTLECITKVLNLPMAYFYAEDNMLVPLIIKNIRIAFSGKRKPLTQTWIL